jgi:hypothetical protein
VVICSAIDSPEGCKQLDDVLHGLKQRAALLHEQSAAPFAVISSSRLGARHSDISRRGRFTHALKGGECRRLAQSPR